MKKKIKINETIYTINHDEDKNLPFLFKDEKHKNKFPWIMKKTGRYYFAFDQKKIEAGKIIRIAYDEDKLDIGYAKGMITVYRDGNPLNLDQKNIKLLSRKKYVKTISPSDSNKQKIIMLPDGKEFNSVIDAATFLAGIGSGSIKTYKSHISKIINMSNDNEGYKSKTILGKSFIKKENHE